MKALFAPFYESNPYQSQLAGKLKTLGVDVRGSAAVGIDRPSFEKDLAQFSPDVLHLHWLHPYFKAGSSVEAVTRALTMIRVLGRARKRGVRIVWTAHNLRNHEGKHPRVDAYVTRKVAKMADAILVHGEKARETLLSFCGQHLVEKCHVIPHGNYVDSYPNTVDQDFARRELGLETPGAVLVSLGRIRPYKGLDTLAQVMESASLPEDSLLVIAGKASRKTAKSNFVQRCQNAGRIRLEMEHVEDERIQLYLNAADIAVIPYHTPILTSGSAVLAMSFGRPLLSPDVGAIRDLTDETGAFFYPLGDGRSMQKALEEAVGASSRWAEMGQHNLTRALEWPWSRVAPLVFQAYQGNKPDLL